MIRVLGVDPGLTRCGLGVVEGVVGRAPRLVAVGVARTSPDAPVAERLVALEAEIERWLDTHRPDAVAVERRRAPSRSWPPGGADSRSRCTRPARSRPR
jgi:crossover junction endodeoxyribonuclease RuvC